VIEDGEGNLLHFIAKYRVSVILAGMVLAFCCTLQVALSAGAVSVIVLPPINNQQNSQSYHGTSNFGNHAIVIGNRQGNTGNAGVNRGFNQDDSLNTGNQVVSQHKPIKTQVNNQFFHQSENSASGSGNSSTMIGAFQGNSGNSGLNFGNNQDNAGNSGNQVNNQGNIIGAQINKQGSSVTNDGNIILHQINYIQLFPNTRIYFSFRPKLTFAVSVGN
jgi:hypothetical protein